MSDHLTQWARSLFKEITEPAAADEATLTPAKAGQASQQGGEGGSPSVFALPVDTPAPDFRYRPVTTSVRRRG